MGKVLCLFTLALLGFCAYADMGVVVYNKYAKVFEPNQRAMIAWNGRHEILVLSTDLYASSTTTVLQVTALPSKPEVKLADTNSFITATKMINYKLADYHFERAYFFGSSIPADTSPARTPPEPGKVVLHERIGVHDISVIQALDSDSFFNWVLDYLKGQGVNDAVIPKALKSSIKGYLRDKFTWFVFDVTTLGKQVKTIDAVQFRFESPFLYYPMRISSTNAGETTVDLLILTQDLMNNFYGIPERQVKYLHSPVSVSHSEIKEINADMAALFLQDDIKLRIWRVKGQLEDFDKDLIVTP